MKKITFYIVIIIAGFLSACEKKLDQSPISTSPEANFYAQTRDFIQAVNAV